MASVILTAAGAAIGKASLGLFGQVLFAAGGLYGGSLIDNLIFGGNSKSSSGKLDSLKVADASYGEGIAKLYGQVRTSGNLIWSSDLIETVTTESSGGKGGGSAVTTETYTYRVNIAIALGENEIGGVSRIWADGDLVYNYGWNTGLVTGSFNVYTGTITQLQDPVMVAALGATNVPAYRGIAYVVIEGLQLEDFGNRIPNLEFEIIPKTSSNVAPYSNGYVLVDEDIKTNSASMIFDPIVLGSESASGGNILVGGFTAIDSTHIKFQISNYKMSGKLPKELYSNTSSSIEVSSYTYSSTTGLSSYSVINGDWALSPDGNYIAILLGGTKTSVTSVILIYSISSESFGSIYEYTSSYAAPTDIEWFDNNTLGISVKSAALGYPKLQVFTREGLNVVSRGEFNVFNSTSYQQPNSYSLFRYKEGLIYLAYGFSSKAQYLYMRYVKWSLGSLIVSNEITLMYGVFVSGASRCNLLNKQTNEFIAVFDGNSAAHYLYSFELNIEDDITIISISITTTRNAQDIVSGVILLNYCSNRFTTLNGNELLCIANPINASYYYLYSVSINSSNFSLNTSQLIQYDTDYPLIFDYFSLIKLSNNKYLLNSFKTPSRHYIQTILRYANYDSQSIAYIIADLLEAAGYTSSDYDVSALATTFINGFIISSPTSARSSIELLRSFALFDLIENDDILEAILYDDTITEIVSIDEMRAALEDEDQPDAIEITRNKESDLPCEVDVDYNNQENDYEVDTQVARRDISTNAYSTSKIQLPISMSPNDARQLAEKTLFAAWAERTKGNVTVGPKHLDLSPGDVVTFDDITLRITKIINRGMLLEIEGNSVIGNVFTSNAVGDSGEGSGNTGTKSSYLTLYLIDLPALLTAHDTTGIFAAASYAGVWKGCAVYRSVDDDYYNLFTSIPIPVTAGISTSTLANGPADYYDRINTVNVSLDNGELESITEASLLDGGNLALLGDEIIQFRTATLISENAYELTDLLRGRFGTDWAINTHSIGETFILLNTSTIQFVTAQLNDQGRNYYYKAAYLGQDLDGILPKTHTVTFNNLKPLSPVHIKGSRISGVGTDLTISWIRRARINAGWSDNADVPIDESTESYEVDIMNGTSVVRTLTSNTTSIVYTSSEQLSDWDTIPSSYEVNIYQLSARVGRGYAGNATI